MPSGLWGTVRGHRRRVHFLHTTPTKGDECCVSTHRRSLRPDLGQIIHGDGRGLEIIECLDGVEGGSRQQSKQKLSSTDEAGAPSGARSEECGAARRHKHSF